MFKEAGLNEIAQKYSLVLRIETQPVLSGCLRLPSYAIFRRKLLYHEGDRAVDFYIILTGQIAIESQVPCHGCVPTFTAGSLDVVGWSCLTAFTRQRTSSARATTDCRLIAMNGEALRAMCDEDHDLGYIIMRRLTNIIASHMLTTRLHLYDIIVQDNQTQGKQRA
jgi:CRP-like cAMP-binding protein